MNVGAWKPYNCPICGVKAYSQSGLDLHNYLLHEGTGGSLTGAAITFRCASCDAAFAQRRELLAHLAAHHKRTSPSGHRAARGRREPLAR